MNSTIFFLLCRQSPAMCRICTQNVTRRLFDKLFGRIVWLPRVVFFFFFEICHSSYLDRPKYISGEFGRIFRARIPSARNVPEIYFGRFKGNLYVIRANSGAFRANSGTFRANSGDFGQIRANSGAQPVSYVCWEACYQCKNLTLYLKDWHKICSKKKKLSKNS